MSRTSGGQTSTSGDGIRLVPDRSKTVRVSCDSGTSGNRATFLASLVSSEGVGSRRAPGGNIVEENRSIGSGSFNSTCLTFSGFSSLVFIHYRLEDLLFPCTPHVPRTTDSGLPQVRRGLGPGHSSGPLRDSESRPGHTTRLDDPSAASRRRKREPLNKRCNTGGKEGRLTSRNPPKQAKPSTPGKHRTSLPLSRDSLTVRVERDEPLTEPEVSTGVTERTHDG